MNNNYPRIFAPMTIRGMGLKNRVLMPPIGSNFATVNAEVSEEMRQYYELRAKGGTGFIIVENACVDFPMGTNGTKQLRIDNNQYVPGLYSLVERIHTYGAKACIQLNHAGASAYGLRLEGAQPVSASKIPSKTGGVVPRALTEPEIYDIVRKYGEAAERAKLAGFDCVEIHGGHSYLICQFLSPLFNQRTDQFGGSLENRTRFASLIIDSVRAAVGPNYPIAFRISADDFIQGGNTLEDTLKIMEYLEAELDILDISAAENDTLYKQIDKMSLAEGWRSYLSKAFKEKFNKAVVVSGNIRSPQVAEDILANGEADLIAMGRGLISEPNWVKKVERGEEHLLRRCISCNIGCANHRIGTSKPLRCSINPDVLFEDDYKAKQLKKPVKVLVIGAGPAGLEAACSAAEVGCDVTIIEEKAQVGGLAYRIGLIPSKSRIHYFVSYLSNRMSELPNLTCRLNTSISKEILAEIEPDLIVNATGSKPLLPAIEGLAEQVDVAGSQVYSTFGFMEHLEAFKGNNAGKKIVVAGGGAVGLDLVEFFAEAGSEVTVVEMQAQLGKDLDVITRLSSFDTMREHFVQMRTNTSLEAIAKDHFVVKNQEGQVEKLEFDHAFVCLGMQANQSVLDLVNTYASESGVEAINIGDSVSARKIIDGVFEGRNIIKTLEMMDVL